MDDDPREAAAKEDGVQIGFPMKEALYRTNNGFSPITREYFSWSQSPDSNSNLRYRLIYHGFLNYQLDGVKVGPEQMLNIT